MITKPIIPIWLMAIICIALLVMKRKGLVPYIRQIIVVVLIFLLNLRFMVPDENVKSINAELNIKVIFVIDDTISMVADDYAGGKQRQEGVKKDCESIINELEGAKFSVISFHNYANTIVPYTRNSDHAIITVQAMEPLHPRGAYGTTYDDCKRELLESLQRATKDDNDNEKIIVFFFGDGEANQGTNIPSFAECKSYIDGGAVLGYGTEQGATMKAKVSFSYNGEEEEKYEYVKDSRTYKNAISKMNEGNLKNIANDLDVTYKNANNGINVKDLVKDIKAGAMSKGTEDEAVGYRDVGTFLVIPIILILLYEFIRFRKERVM